MVAAHSTTLNDLAYVPHHGMAHWARHIKRVLTGFGSGWHGVQEKLPGRPTCIEYIATALAIGRLFDFTVHYSWIFSFLVFDILDMLACAFIPSVSKHTTHSSHPTQGRLCTAPWTTVPYRENAQMHFLLRLRSLLSSAFSLSLERFLAIQTIAQQLSLIHVVSLAPHIDPFSRSPDTAPCRMTTSCPPLPIMQHIGEQAAAANHIALQMEPSLTCEVKPVKRAEL